MVGGAKPVTHPHLEDLGDDDPLGLPFSRYTESFHIAGKSGRAHKYRHLSYLQGYIQGEEPARAG